MREFYMATSGGRDIPTIDKIFGISMRAKALIAEKGKEFVINATIGALLDDESNLIVLDGVDKAFRSLTLNEYAEYAPIGGSQAFKNAVQKAAFKNFVPTRFVESMATPGGCGAIRNTIANYSNVGDSILTSDWHWSPYRTIAGELGRGLETFPLFSEEGTFNQKAFKAKLNDMILRQERVVVILNTPAHNPTGYALSLDDWNGIVSTMHELPLNSKITLLVDVAYIDFAGDEDEYRAFFPLLEQLPENVLPIIAYSLSKTFTMYGMRGGAAVCLAPTMEIKDEFRRVFEYSSRASWSNSPIAAQSILTKIYENEDLYNLVSKQRDEIRSMLLRRGKAFEQASHDVELEILPFDAGFFVSIPCDKPDKIARELEKEGIFVVPLDKGLRVSVASINEDACRQLPKRIKAVFEQCE